MRLRPETTFEEVAVQLENRDDRITIEDLRSAWIWLQIYWLQNCLLNTNSVITVPRTASLTINTPEALVILGQKIKAQLELQSSDISK